MPPARANALSMQPPPAARDKPESAMGAALRVQLVQRRDKNIGGVHQISGSSTSLLESASGGKRHSERLPPKRTPAAAGHGTETVVWVGGLQFVYAGPGREVPPAQLRAAFETIGEVEAVFRAPAEPRNWALVVFSRASCVAEAVRLPPEINGVPLQTQAAFLLEATGGNEQQQQQQQQQQQGQRRRPPPWQWGTACWLVGLDTASANPLHLAELCGRFGKVGRVLLRSKPGKAAAAASWAVIHFEAKEAALRAAMAKEVGPPHPCTSALRRPPAAPTCTPSVSLIGPGWGAWRGGERGRGREGQGSRALLVPVRRRRREAAAAVVA